ncbi:MAG: MarR family transcriptional regulator [Myxococcales bacterium]|nr:MarR family transcriptional regulator [Myxococcales bacterium]
MLPPLRLTFKRATLLAGHWARQLALVAKLTPARADLMLLLRDHPMLQSGIIREMCVSAPVVSRMLKALEGLGLVQRRPHPSDRRYRIVELTRLGHEALAPLLEDLLPEGDEAGTVQDAAESITLTYLKGPLTQLAIQTDIPCDRNLRETLPTFFELVRRNPLFTFLAGSVPPAPDLSPPPTLAPDPPDLWNGREVAA